MNPRDSIVDVIHRALLDADRVHIDVKMVMAWPEVFEVAHHLVDPLCMEIRARTEAEPDELRT